MPGQLEKSQFHGGRKESAEHSRGASPGTQMEAESRIMGVVFAFKPLRVLDSWSLQSLLCSKETRLK